MQLSKTILALSFIFIPAFAQENSQSIQVKDTTVQLFNELQELKQEKIALIDSLNHLKEKFTNRSNDSEAYDVKTRQFIRYYNVYKTNGDILQWQFNYKIRQNIFTRKPDTVFKFVNKVIIGQWE